MDRQSEEKKAKRCNVVEQEKEEHLEANPSPGLCVNATPYPDRGARPSHVENLGQLGWRQRWVLLRLPLPRCSG